ncbi:MAG: zinc ribbon protein, partial [Solirubrobacterales bacterium]|nr:zinc ribbon protein [Solirubrobacterales bacterium]
MIADPTIELYGTDGEPCVGCRAPLTGSQRYCLHCGTRRPQARAEFLDILAADAREFGLVGPGQEPAGHGGPPGPPVPVGVPAGGAEAWLRARQPFLALGGLLLVTLLIGLLVGHWATADPSAGVVAAPAPQVIRI